MASIVVSGDTSGAVTITAPAIAGTTTLTLPTTSGTIVTTGGAASLTTSGNLTFTGTGNRITGDMSNATVANRVAFQTSTTDTNTTVGILPNGTAISSFFTAYNSSDPTNTSFTQIGMFGTESRITSGITGTGTYRNLTMYTGGSERLRIDTSGNVGINTTPVANTTSKLFVAGDFTRVGASGGYAFNVYYDSVQARWEYAGTGTGAGWIDSGSGNYTFQSTGSTSGNAGDAASLTERMRITSGGNVGIGTSSPTTRLSVVSGTNAGISVNDGTVNTIIYNSTGGVGSIGTTTNHPVDFYTNNSARMRIASNGVVSIGTTNQSAQLTVAASTTGIYSAVTGAFVAGYFTTSGANYGVYGQSDANYGVYGRTTDATYGGCIGVAGNGTTYGIIGYANAWGLYTNASISVNGTTYTSDARLKENVQPISNALNTITQLNPVSFDWKANSSKGITNNNQPLPDYGMIAQEVEQVLPDIVYEVPVPPKPLENNEPDSLEQELGSCKGVDYSRLIPFLTKAIQELKTIVDNQKIELDNAKAEIQALKGVK